VLADAREEGADEWLLGGDYALFGAWPAEAVARLRELSPARWIRGNGERWTASPEETPDAGVRAAAAACSEALGAATVAELAALPFSARDGDTLYVHASPVSDVESLGPDPADGDDARLGGVEGLARLVVGHTHLPFRRPGPGGVEVVNPGSVGMPFDGDPRAAYALIGADGDVEHRRVAYDHAASAAALRDRYGAEGWAATPARRLDGARP
jgi:diadenosine tetraphosphatase ApaH/serine/threonine PP2A family protein phosphatase